MGKKEGWIGVDLDGTLAEYNGWVSPTYIGPPIHKMVNRVKQWLDEGRDVRIFTARASLISAMENNADIQDIHDAIHRWCRRWIGQIIPITCEKDMHMEELWDDRCVQVVLNTGLRVDGK